MTTSAWAVMVETYSDYEPELFCLAATKEVADQIVAAVDASTYRPRHHGAFTIGPRRIYDNPADALSVQHHSYVVDLTIDDGRICGWTGQPRHEIGQRAPHQHTPTRATWQRQRSPYTKNWDSNRAADDIAHLRRSEPDLDLEDVAVLERKGVVPYGWDQPYGTLRVSGTSAADVKQMFRDYLGDFQAQPDLRLLAYWSDPAETEPDF